MLIDTNLRDTDLGLFPHRWKGHTKQTWHKVGSLYFTVCFPLCGGKSQSLKLFLSLKEPGMLCAVQIKGTLDGPLFYLDSVLSYDMELTCSNTWHRNESQHGLVSFSRGSRIRTSSICLCTPSGTAETFGIFVRVSVCSGLRASYPVTATTFNNSAQYHNLYLLTFGWVS